MKKLVMWVAALGVAAVLSACGSSSTSGEAARTIAGQVADYSGPAGVLEADMNTDRETPASIGTGAISADGNFSLELVDAVAESALYTLEFDEACTGVSVSNPDVKGASVSEFSVMAAGETAGYLVLMSENSDTEVDSEAQIVWLYVDQSTTVRGTCEYADSFGVERDTYNLNLKKGWNIVSLESNYDEANDTTESRLYNGKASGVKWFYY